MKASAVENETAPAIWARVAGAWVGEPVSPKLSVPNLAAMYAERALMRELLRQALADIEGGCGACRTETTKLRDAIKATLEAK